MCVRSFFSIKPDLNVCVGMHDNKTLDNKRVLLGAKHY